MNPWRWLSGFFEAGVRTGGNASADVIGVLHSNLARNTFQNSSLRAAEPRKTIHPDIEWFIA